MQSNSLRRRVALIFLLIAVALLVWIGGLSAHDGEAFNPFQSPINPTPSLPAPQPTQGPSPTVTPAPSPETQIALDNIAARDRIPVERLLSVNAHQREYGILGKAFWYVKALDRESRHFYTAMVDLSDGRSPTDVEKVERALRQALEARYGKLEPQLYERLQPMGQDEMVNVAVWFAPIDRRALLAQLQAKHPNVPTEPLERPWREVNDSARADQIRVDYYQFRQEAHLGKQAGLAQSLRARGYEIQLHQGVPSLVAQLPKRVILEIARRSDVSRLYLIEGELVPLLASAIPTARGNVVWQRGFTGAGRRIAIVDPRIVPMGHPSINVIAVRTDAPPYFHAAGVASAAASHHSTYTGMAPQAEIVSAGVNGIGDNWDDVDDAILWAYNNYGVRIVNASFTSTTGQQSDDMQWIDRVFDYYARYYQITMIAAAGNQLHGNHIGSPAKGYNVIAVGGTDDKNNTIWGDDVIWWNAALQQGSAWKNPKRDDGVFGDREKPKVVAAAKDLTLLNENNQTYTDSGTSYSAPQVAGLAALMAHRNPDLYDEPQAMRAIIMASAIHNIDGPTGIPTGQDLKDGAGAIDAASADTVAATGYSDTLQYPYPACEAPCWWSNWIHNNLPSTPSAHFPPGTHRWYYFKASSGARIRIALTWDSNPAGSGSNYYEDPLATDLDLDVYDPDGQRVGNGISASNDNNYELVDFVAAKTGQYAIGVYKKSGVTELNNYLGLAWVKVVPQVYVPLLLSD